MIPPMPQLCICYIYNGLHPEQFSLRVDFMISVKLNLGELT